MFVSQNVFLQRFRGDATEVPIMAAPSPQPKLLSYGKVFAHSVWKYFRTVSFFRGFCAAYMYSVLLVVFSRA